MDALNFFEICFSAIYEFLTAGLLSGSGFIYLVVFTYCIYTCIVCPFWGFLHVPDRDHVNAIRRVK